MEVKPSTKKELYTRYCSFFDAGFDPRSALTNERKTIC